MTEQNIADLICFLDTLTDGYQPPAGDDHRPGAVRRTDRSILAAPPLVLVAAVAQLSAAARRPTPTPTPSRAPRAYLEQRGDLCLAKSAWPIDVTRTTSSGHARTPCRCPCSSASGS